MFPVAFLLAFALGWPAMGFDLGLSTRCVAIPKEMAMCHEIGYSEMRLPNFLGHTSLAQVVPKSAEWQNIVRTGCHRYARTFLCSLFAPVCLDMFIQPCRSMCVAVRNSCAPVLECHGLAWPDHFGCDRFPADEDICLASLTKDYEHHLKVFPKPTCQICPVVEEFLVPKNMLDIFCTNHFAVKVKLSRKPTTFSVQEYDIDCQVEFIRQGLLLPYDPQRTIERWLLINENCTRKMTSPLCPSVYLIVGTVGESNVLVNHVFRWHRRESQLPLATWRWRYHKCV